MDTALPREGCRKSVLVSYNPHLQCRNSAASTAVLSAEAFYGLVYEGQMLFISGYLNMPVSKCLGFCS